jgi:hypothetical protein
VSTHYTTHYPLHYYSAHYPLRTFQCVDLRIQRLRLLCEPRGLAFQAVLEPDCDSALDFSLFMHLVFPKCHALFLLPCSVVQFIYIYSVERGSYMWAYSTQYRELWRTGVCSAYCSAYTLIITFVAFQRCDSCDQIFEFECMQALCVVQLGTEHIHHACVELHGRCTRIRSNCVCGHGFFGRGGW